MTEWELILALTECECCSVTVLSDNGGFDGPNCAIIFTVMLDEYYQNGVMYSGDTKLECLEKAYQEYQNRMGVQ